MSLKGRTIHSWYLAALISVAVLPRLAAAQSFVPANDTVLHAFQGGSGDGKIPAMPGGVVFDAVGNLYGATSYGGSGGSNCFGGSCGTVYELSPSGHADGSWNETVIYNFGGEDNNNDGEVPTSGLTLDKNGNLFGVTAYGGTGGCNIGGGQLGCGTVYEMSAPSQPGGSWIKTTVYSFQGGSDGYLPYGNLIFDTRGNLYGSTQYGGGFGSCNAPFYQYCGTVFQLSPPTHQGGAWTEKVLYSFKNGIDGATPNGGLVLDSKGALYGTTYYGGAVYRDARLELECQAPGGIGCGTVFKLQPPTMGGGAWEESVIHRFQGTDGSSVNGGLKIDDEGNLYGTTEWGGGSEGVGAVFELSPPETGQDFWNLSIVFGFDGNTGTLPTGPLTSDGSGGFYGTATEQGAYSAGQVFHLSRSSPDSNSWNYSAICNFATGNQAEAPAGELTIDTSGNIFGLAAAFDHVGNGAVYRIKLTADPIK